MYSSNFVDLIYIDFDFIDVYAALTQIDLAESCFMWYTNTISLCSYKTVQLDIYRPARLHVRIWKINMWRASCELLAVYKCTL